MTLAAAHRLRRLAAALAAGEALTAADAAWLADRFGAYLDGAAEGVTLDDVLGLVPGRGGEHWWRTERRARRDDAVRALAGQVDGPDSRRAELVARRLTHYAATGWRTDRRLSEPPVDGAAGRAEMWIAVAMNDGEPLSVRTVRRILEVADVPDQLGHETPPFRGQAPRADSTHR
ncbi:hypothetical protein CCR97_18960 [Rhodoplanes elegans]|uniref:Uncharacterized protein n=1 Tax=Rhodoplanes elegans TaxID=29408 RepID=A0A327KSU1_9BRAD|nr:hypothetical protein [Rhodoplanes elegans]MBK5960265.1 hypothetical protein [Rhodoplanes elegans]RAI40713.1 hypothetical protein CH338_05345 [Rhodoplanes elegans]